MERRGKTRNTKRECFCNGFSLEEGTGFPQRRETLSNDEAYIRVASGVKDTLTTNNMTGHDSLQRLTVANKGPETVQS